MRLKHFLSMIAVAAVAGIGSLTLQHGVSPKSPAPEAVNASGISVTKDVTDKPKQAPKSPSAMTDSPTAGPTETPVPFATELKLYQAVRNKVFMSETEKTLRKSFLNDGRMLMALGEYLKTVSIDTADTEEARNNATDLLLEAVQTEKSEAAEQALQSVIMDEQIENENLDLEARKSLANTKAEVLYHWSAMDPARSEQIQSWLPGPVSEKIWQNVRQAQNQNLAESKDFPK